MEGDTKVTFTVSAGDVATKAKIADGTNVDILYWEIYGEDITTAAKPLGEGFVKGTDPEKTFTVDLSLIADQTYNIVFWAQVDGQKHYVVDDLRSVKIDTYADEASNDETRAAFFAKHQFTTENGRAISETVYLRRPFSQINLGATNLETSLNNVNGGKVSVESTQVTVSNIANTFNTITGMGEGEDMAVTFSHASTPMAAGETLNVNDKDYYWLGMNYLIVTGDSDNVKVDVEVKTNMGSVSHSVDNVPVKENYRTNILGDFLTTSAVFTVVVDEKFYDDEIVKL